MGPEQQILDLLEACCGVVAMGCAIKVFLFDEPLNLDAKLRVQAAPDQGTARRTRHATVGVTHDQVEAKS